MSKLIFFILVIFINLSFATSCEYSEPSTKFIYGKTMDTIGDSITWVENGNYLRCLFRDKGLSYDFVGNHLDKFGFMHDGEGGDNTQAVLNRIGAIPYANAYFLLIGTNDVGVSAPITFKNIMTIGYFLHAKNANAPIFINTLLPTTTKYNNKNQEVNAWLLAAAKQHKLCPNCYIIDAGLKFYQLPNWQQYIDGSGVHLTKDGYEIFTSLVMESFKYIQ